MSRGGEEAAFREGLGHLSQGALEGDYKTKYKKTRDEMLKRPGKGVDALLKRMYASKKRGKKAT